MKFNKYFDHTNLKPDATKDDIRTLCEEAKKYDFASVCVNGVYTAFTKECLSGSDVKTCVVVGFPLGAMSTDVKAYETKKAVEDGADEIDYVINIGELKNGNYSYIKKEMESIVKVCRDGNVLCKVIFENCYLTREEIKKTAEIAKEAGPDFIKTSTGFGTSGADASDVRLMKETVGDHVKVKAAGGIRSWEVCRQMIDAGAERIGTSSSLEILKEFDMERASADN